MGTYLKYLLWAVLLLPGWVHAQFTFTTNDGAITITGYTGQSDNIIVPSTTNGFPVTSIAAGVFNEYTTVSIPGSITSLADGAFSSVQPEFDWAGWHGVFFQGNAPAGEGAFFYDAYPDVYYLPGTTGWGTNFAGAPAQLWFPAEFQLFMSPATAIAYGARWRVGGGAWQTNGATVANLTEGNHVISYKSVPGWRTPDDQIMFVDTNFINSTNGSAYDCPQPGVQQQTVFQIIHDFAGNEGAQPMGGLIIYSNRLYGTTSAGGTSGNGTLFAINTDGTGFTNLYQFPGGTGGYGSKAGLAQSGNVFYGTTLTTVFRINADGSGFTNLCNVDDSYAGVVLSSNRLYGTTINGGTNGRDMLYAVNTDGSCFQDLHDFDISAYLAYSGVALSGDTLYGSTLEGRNGGCIYKLKTDGTGYTVIYRKPYDSPLLQSKMMISGNLLYWGSTFTINTDGTGVAYLGDGQDYGPNSVLSGKTFYAVDGFGGPQLNAHGTIFAVRTDGSGYTNLYTFPGGSGGGDFPQATLLLSGTTLYGTTALGGVSTNGPAYFGGTIFFLTFPLPQLTITSSGINLALSWPSGVEGAGYDNFMLQSTTNLLPPVTWNTNSLSPILINNQNVVNLPLPGGQTFYRLAEPPDSPHTAAQ